MLQAGAGSSGQYTINCRKSGANTADLIFRTRDGGAASKETLRINQHGNVGIGSTGTDQRLNVSGNIELNAYDSANGSGGYYTAKGLIIGNAYDAGITGLTDDRNGIIWQERGLDLDFATNNTLRMKITYDGKVGINESANINGRLHVQHDGLAENILYATRYNDQSNDKPILAITEAQMTGMSVSGLIIGNHNRPIHIGAVFDSSAAVTTSSTTGMTLISDGNIGINETAPDTKLHISHSNAGADVLKIEATPVTAGTGIKSKVVFHITQSNNQSARLAEIHSHALNGWGGELSFSTKIANSTPNNTVTERVRIQANGSTKFSLSTMPSDDSTSNIILGLSLIHI